MHERVKTLKFLYYLSSASAASCARTRRLREASSSGWEMPRRLHRRGSVNGAQRRSRGRQTTPRVRRKCSHGNAAAPHRLPVDDRRSTPDKRNNLYCTSLRGILATRNHHITTRNTWLLSYLTAIKIIQVNKYLHLASNILNQARNAYKTENATTYINH